MIQRPDKPVVLVACGCGERHTRVSDQRNSGVAPVVWYSPNQRRVCLGEEDAPVSARERGAVFVTGLVCV